MKTVLLLLTLLVIQSSVFAQTEISLREAEAIADKLVARSFLTPAGKTIMLRELSEGKIETEHRSTVYPISYTSKILSKESILQFCHAALITETAVRVSSSKYEEEKVAEPEPLIDTQFVFHSMDFIGGRPEYRGAISEQTSVFGQTRRRTLQTFIEAGLLSKQVQEEVEKEIETKKIKNERELAAYCLARSTYYTWYEFNKKEQVRFMGELQAAGIIDQRGRDSLVASFRDQELKSLTEMLLPSRHFQLVEYSDSVPPPSIAYPRIFRKIQALIPEFKYRDLNVSIVESKDYDLIRQDLRISFSVDGIPYVYDVFYDYYHSDSAKDVKTEPYPFQEDFQKPVNKWLTDIGSPYRLYIITERQLSDPMISQIGLILLREGQANVISQDAYVITNESYDTRMSRKNILNLQQQLEQYGFFRHLSASTRDSVKNQMLTAFSSSFVELMALIPSTVVAFDFEMANLENPYEELTIQFAEATRGACKVSNIIDQYSKAGEKTKTIKYGFTMNGKAYRANLAYESDWIDPKFMELFSNAMKENKVNGKFYQCLSDGQVGGYIFLTSEQHQFIKANYPDLVEER